MCACRRPCAVDHALLLRGRFAIPYSLSPRYLTLDGVDMIGSDLALICENCLQYNGGGGDGGDEEDNVYCKAARELQAAGSALVAEARSQWEAVLVAASMS